MKKPREICEAIFRAGLRAVDPAALVRQAAPQIATALRHGDYRQLSVLACGKAAAAMASALEEDLADAISAGVVITKYGHAAGHPCRRCAIYEAGHPLPDAAGVAATVAALALVDAADAATLVTVLLSGGGSALLVAPAPGLTLTEKQATTELLLRAGADIRELNTVRKHLSAVKGGQLAQRAWPATVLTLILSDVIGDPLDVIASGPTAADPSTFDEALAVLERYRLTAAVPAAVLTHLQCGRAGEIPETPNPTAPIFDRVENRILGNNRLALDAAAAAARALGCTVHVLSDRVSGEARTAARWLAGQARTFQSDLPPGTRLCLLAGGETTVTVRGPGTGGRNQELALAFAGAIAGTTGITLLSAGTDGTDGPTDAAGAFADGTTVARALQLGLAADGFLTANDAYHFFTRAGGLLRTGPTGTNVMDLQIVLIEAPV